MVLYCAAVCSISCIVLQCVASCCSVLQCVMIAALCYITCGAGHYVPLFVVCCSVLHCVAVCCSVLWMLHYVARQVVLGTPSHFLQCVAVCCSVLQPQHTATHCNTLQHTATHYKSWDPTTQHHMQCKISKKQYIHMPNDTYAIKHKHWHFLIHRFFFGDPVQTGARCRNSRSMRLCSGR